MIGTHRLVVDLAATSRNWALPPDGAEQIRAAAPDDWEVMIARSPTSSDGDGSGGTSAEVLASAEDCEVYFGFGLSKDFFQQAAQLRWVHSAAAGVASVLFPEMKSSEVVLTNSAGIMGAPIAELVLGGVLYFLRSLDVAVDHQRRREWNKTPFVGDAATVREVSECRVLVVGTGGIGGAVAERLTALGARCVGIRRRPEEGAPPGFQRVTSLDHIDSELPGADIFVLATPLTGATQGLLTGTRMDLLPRSAIVVNVARGALLDENALADRIEAGRLRGAVLDVFHAEPLPARSPLWGLRGVLITPHVAAVSPRLFWARELELFLDNWQRYRDGRPLRNLVDKEAGY